MTKTEETWVIHLKGKTIEERATNLLTALQTSPHLEEEEREIVESLVGQAILQPIDTLAATLFSVLEPAIIRFGEDVPEDLFDSLEEIELLLGKEQIAELKKDYIASGIAYAARKSVEASYVAASVAMIGEANLVNQAIVGSLKKLKGVAVEIDKTREGEIREMEKRIKDLSAVQLREAERGGKVASRLEEKVADLTRAMSEGVS